jgi:transposase-like protein/IS1 family transposase
MQCPLCGGPTRRYGFNRNGSQRYRCDGCDRKFTDERTRPRDGRRLSPAKSLDCLRHLLEGTSIRSTERLLAVHRDTIIAAAVAAGTSCQRWLENTLRDVEVADVQADKIWGFVYCKEKTRLRENWDETCGDAYCYVAFERATKLVLTWHLGKRCPADTAIFARKLRDATSGRFQLSTDGYLPYRTAVPSAFGPQIDFAQIVKVYGNAPEAERRYTPPAVISTTLIPCMGDPDMDRVCTSHVERNNLNMRMMIRRLTRLTNAFSKKWENHEAMLALFFAYYNFCRWHMTLKETPAMRAGLTDHIWPLRELLERAA